MQLQYNAWHLLLGQQHDQENGTVERFHIMTPNGFFSLTKSEMAEEFDYYNKTAYDNPLSCATMSRFRSALFEHNRVLIFRHMGYECDEVEIAKRANEIIRNYYTTNWYLADPDEEKQLKKDRNNKDFEWYRFFSLAIWSAMLFGTDDVVKAVANYPETWFTPEWIPIQPDPLLGKLLISIASEFRDTPLDGLDEMESTIASTRKKELRLYWKAWAAVKERDSVAFNSEIQNCVSHLLAKEPTTMAVEECFAMVPSLILSAGLRVGMKMPDLEPEILYRLPRRKSIFGEERAPF